MKNQWQNLNSSNAKKEKPNGKNVKNSMSKFIIDTSDEYISWQTSIDGRSQATLYK